MDNTNELVVSFCSGYGGIELGLELAGLAHRTVAYVEIEAFVVANLVAKMEEGKLVPAPVWTNLKTFPAKRFRGLVDGITGGYPCQPFSHAGQRKGENDPRHLWPYIKQHIKDIVPRWCFFENVEGHISMGLSTVISDLEEMGYTVSWGVFSASEVGAPHQRKRVFILANSGSVHSTRANQNRIDSGRVCQLSRGQTVRSEDRGCCESSPELAESTDARAKGVCGREEPTDQDVANGLGEYAQGQRSDNNKERRQEPDGPIGLCCGTRWPARPGEPQYEWEEPRVMADSGSGGPGGGKPSVPDRMEKRKSVSSEKGEGTHDVRSETAGRDGEPLPKSRCQARDKDATKIQTKPDVGCTIDGFNARVDMLRLLGNGVVPQTAARAYAVLSEENRKKMEAIYE